MSERLPEGQVLGLGARRRFARERFSQVRFFLCREPGRMVRPVDHHAQGYESKQYGRNAFDMIKLLGTSPRK